MLFEKNLVRISFCALSLSLFFSSPAGAFWPFSDYELQKNTEVSKEIFEKNKDELESTKNDCAESISNIDEIIFQIEPELNDFKDSNAALEKQLKKLNVSYNEWAAKDYVLSGDSYAKFTADKEEFDRFTDIVKLKKEVLKTFFNKLLNSTEKDLTMCEKYKSDMNKSIESYYEYGLAVARNISGT